MSDYIGPVLPPHLLNKESDTSDSTAEPKPADDVYGPSLPPHLQKAAVDNSDEDEDTYGPLPEGTAGTHAHQALEERAYELKLGYLDPKEETKVREEWMLELPVAGASKLGLGPRQFRKNAGPDLSDRSSWTDTPRSKKLKKGEEVVDLKKEAMLKDSQEYDAKQASMVKKHRSKNKRDKSLLQIHQDNLKEKKKKDTEDGPTRRPFNRDIDLKVNQFDDAQKKSIIKKAMHLDDRFSSGQSKFL
ncbi:hypothetical protein PPYR_01915 [Photinus pyralis]|uniref:DUF3752 domain-containing protein n=1 Tax=Photinus pyralis TaxID=7054 RepID=A0A1Y1LGZ1_PHOPY|nr:GPALPP motifs-containing protein 1 [Photinus pyralis]KAB0804945.1 hypothetical protein PPYR_01915 [Photinus pyralis]